MEIFRVSHKLLDIKITSRRVTMEAVWNLRNYKSAVMEPAEVQGVVKRLDIGAFDLLSELSMTWTT